MLTRSIFLLLIFFLIIPPIAITVNADDYTEIILDGSEVYSKGGVLFIDEIATLQPHTQQELLSALQEKKFSITGQSERSAGAMVRTEPVPCDFILVAAGNLATLKDMHPALRSRIRGYGYEIYMNDTIQDTQENRDRQTKRLLENTYEPRAIAGIRSRRPQRRFLQPCRRFAGSDH